MSKDHEIRDLVKQLVGSWEGRGRGSFPTIDDFEYRESLVFGARTDHPALHYDQRTWKTTDDGEAASHWETGLIDIDSNGEVKVFSAQGDRTEVLQGRFRPDGSGFLIDLQSTGFAGDPRMRATSRTLRVSEGELTYRMSMATDRVGSLTSHLEATLRRATDRLDQ